MRQEVVKVEGRTVTVLPAAPARRRVAAAGLVAALVSASLAGAQDVAGLVTAAETGTNGIQAAVFTVLGIALAIGIGVWAVRHLKPKG